MFSWFRRNQLNMLVVGILIGILVASLFESINTWNLELEWRSGFWQNFSTEIMGALVTFFLFEMVIASRREQEARIEANAEQLERLIRIMQSIEHVPSTNAVEELRARNWLKDGSLSNRNMKNAHLAQLHLADANFEGSDLTNANLRDTNLENADLENVILEGANLQNADLSNADLKGAILCNADISTTNFTDSDMRGASMKQAKTGAYTTLEERFGHVRLPDGTRWSREVYMARFTDPNHPNYASTLTNINKIRRKMGLNPVE